MHIKTYSYLFLFKHTKCLLKCQNDDVKSFYVHFSWSFLIFLVDLGMYLVSKATLKPVDKHFLCIPHQFILCI